MQSSALTRRGWARRPIGLRALTHSFLRPACLRNCASSSCRQAPLALTDSRLLRAAAAASQQAAVSSRQELYPRGMPAVRALKLSHGALIGLPFLTVEQVRERVGSRYPEAERVPDPPELDALLAEAGFELRWDAGARDGLGCYVNPYRNRISVSSQSDVITRQPTSPGMENATEITPEEADARQFEERLNRAIAEGSFLTLLVSPGDHEQARMELCRRFPVELVDFEGLFLECLTQVVERSGVNWDLVVQTDEKPREGDWDKLMILVGRAMPLVEERFLRAEKPVLMIYPDLLARYDQMQFLGEISQKVGRRGGIRGLWLLVPGDRQALVDGKPIPLIGPGQRAHSGKLAAE